MNILIYDEKDSNKLIGWFEFEAHTFLFDKNTCFEDVLLNAIKEQKEEYWEYTSEKVICPDVLSFIMNDHGYKNRWIPIPYDAKSATAI